MQTTPPAIGTQQFHNVLTFDWLLCKSEMWTTRKQQLKCFDPYWRDLKYVTPPAPSAIGQKQQHQLHQVDSLFRHQKYQGNRLLHVQICIKALPEKFSICKPVIATSDFPMILTADVWDHAEPKPFPAIPVRKRVCSKQQHINAAPSHHTKWKHTRDI